MKLTLVVDLLLLQLYLIMSYVSRLIPFSAMMHCIEYVRKSTFELNKFCILLTIAESKAKI